MTRRDAQAGFTLVELMISLLLTLLALGLAAQVLMESAQVLTDTAAEQIDAPVPLALARIRGDVQSSRSYSVISGSPGSRLMLFGHPAGTLVYEQSGGELTRTVLDPLGSPLGIVAHRAEHASQLRQRQGADVGAVDDAEEEEDALVEDASELEVDGEEEADAEEDAE